MDLTGRMPKDENLEAILISMMLNDEDALQKGVFRLNHEHFYIAKNRQILDAIKKIKKEHQDVNMLTISLEMKKDKLWNQTMQEYLNTIVDMTSSGAKIDSMIELAYEYANRRRLIRTSMTVVNSILDGKDSDEVSKHLKEIDLIQKLSKIRKVKGNIQDRVKTANELSQREMDLLGLPLSSWSITQEILDGIQPGFYLVAGKAQSAKSMFLLNLGLQAIEHNKNARVLYFSIDDSFRTGYYRILSYYSNMGISDVALIRRYLRKIGDKELRKKAEQRFENAVNRVEKIMSRFFLLDSNDGGSWVFIRDTIEEFAEKYDQLIVMIDNFHVIRKDNLVLGEDERFGFDKLSYLIKETSNRFDVPIITTAELRKLNHLGRPTPDDMKETGSLDYDSDVQFLLHNDMRMKQGQTELKAKIHHDEFIFADDFDDHNKVFPIIEANIQKNKLTGLEEKVYFVLAKPLSIMHELPMSMQKKCRQIKVSKSMPKEDKE